MSETIGETVLYLLVGMKAKISAPARPIMGEGWFPSTDEETVGSKDPQVPKKGFIVEDEKIGTIEPVSDNEVAVIYTHKMAQENKVWFFAATGEVAVCTISAVPIHDHSSIVQGGPAFGSYFSDDEADQSST